MERRHNRDRTAARGASSTAVTGVCEVCGSHDIEHFAEEAGFELVRCPVCRLVFVSPQPGKDALAAWYERKISAGAGEDYWAGYTANEPSFRSHGRYVLRLIRPLASPPGHLLEIGCGPGFFLDEARKAGWEVCGVDLVEPFVRWAREEFGLDVRRGELEDEPLPADHFNAVVMLDVLSHLPAPRRTMGEVNRILRPGGVLFVQAGVKAEAGVKRPGDNWETPLHLFHYTRGTLRRLVAGCGFEMDRMLLVPRLHVPAVGRRLGRSIPLAWPIYRIFRRLAGVFCSSRQVPDSTVYLAARKR